MEELQRKVAALEARLGVNEEISGKTFMRDVAAQLVLAVIDPKYESRPNASHRVLAYAKEHATALQACAAKVKKSVFGFASMADTVISNRNVSIHPSRLGLREDVDTVRKLLIGAPYLRVQFKPEALIIDCAEDLLGDV
jgi:hypothetical protein